MEYKGYTAHIDVSLDDNVIWGKLEGIDDLILFEGRTPEEVERAFREAVDDYLEACKKFGDEPQQPRRAAA